MDNVSISADMFISTVKSRLKNGKVRDNDFKAKQEIIYQTLVDFSGRKGDKEYEAQLRKEMPAIMSKCIVAFRNSL
jgi:hypothetical protein